jgi:hypothetical protein
MRVGRDDQQKRLIYHYIAPSNESSYNKYGRAVCRSNQQKAHIPVVVTGARTVDE